MQPVENAAAAAAAVLTRTLQGGGIPKCQAIPAKFSGKYPFSPRGEDAAFADVMDFFRRRPAHSGGSTIAFSRRIS